MVEQCLQEADRNWKQIDAIAVTRGPGLVGALLVGMAYAKGLAYALKIPFVGINHLEGHIASILLDHPQAEFPALSLVVSGGHTSLFYLKEPGDYQEISRTGDDAAGEALDKLAKHLGLGYPAIIKIKLLQNSPAKDYFESIERLLLRTLLSKLEKDNSEKFPLNLEETKMLQKIYEKYKKHL